MLLCASRNSEMASSQTEGNVWVEQELMSDCISRDSLKTKGCWLIWGLNLLREGEGLLWRDIRTGHGIKLILLGHLER